MSVQYSVTVRNARGDVTESTIGTSPILKFWTGSKPASCATADAGSLIASATLPSDWLANASNGIKTLLGTWSSPSAAGTGTPGYFRIYDSTGTTCHMQGTVTYTGGGGDMTIDATSVTAGQTVTVTAFTTTEGNA